MPRVNRAISARRRRVRAASSDRSPTAPTAASSSPAPARTRVAVTSLEEDRVHHERGREQGESREQGEPRADGAGAAQRRHWR